MQQLPGTSAVFVSKPPALHTFKVTQGARAEAASPLLRKVVLLVYNKDGHAGCYVIEDLGTLSVPVQTEFNRAPSYNMIGDPTAWVLAPPLTLEALTANCSAAEPHFGNLQAAIWTIPAGGYVGPIKPKFSAVQPSLTALLWLTIPEEQISLQLPHEATFIGSNRVPVRDTLVRHLQATLDWIGHHPHCRFDVVIARIAFVDKTSWNGIFTASPPSQQQLLSLLKSRRQLVELSVERQNATQLQTQIDVLIFVVPALTVSAPYTVFTIPVIIVNDTTASAAGA